jgi:hypothetical protein
LPLPDAMPLAQETNDLEVGYRFSRYARAVVLNLDSVEALPRISTLHHQG